MPTDSVLARTDPRVEAALRRLIRPHAMMGWSYSSKLSAYTVKTSDSSPIVVSRREVVAEIERQLSRPLTQPHPIPPDLEETNASPESDNVFESDDAEPVGDSENDAEPESGSASTSSSTQSPRGAQAQIDELERRWAAYAAKHYDEPVPTFQEAWDYATARRDESVAAHVLRGMWCVECKGVNVTRYSSEVLIDALEGDRYNRYTKPVCEFHAVEELLATGISKLDRFKDNKVEDME